jgi:hypothetical protein
MLGHQAFVIIWMKETQTVGIAPLLNGETVIIERGLVEIKSASIGP